MVRPVTVKVGFLGGGLIANYHGKMLHTGAPEAEIVIVYDTDPSRARAFAEASGAKVALSEQEVLDGSDAVYICTWTSEHRRLVEAAAASGLPVFCEKPLATNVEGARAMVDAVSRAGITNQVGLVLRDSPAFLLLRRQLQRPENGRVMGVVFRDDQYIPIQGMYGSTWRADRDRAGAGTLLEHSIHDLDLLEWLFGPIVNATAATSSFHDLDGIEDVAAATMRMATGAIATLTSVWHDVLERPSLRRMEVFCEHAYYVLEGDVLGPLGWTCAGEAVSLEGEDLWAAVRASGIEPRNPDAAFIEAVVAGGPAYPAFEAALRPHLLVDALYRSAEAGGAPVATGP